jgi:hypothetical protein
MSLRSTPPAPLEDLEVARARRRASVVAVVAGLTLLLWFQITRLVVDLKPDTPGSDAPDDQFVEFYVGNASRLPWHATMFVVQWTVMLVLLAAVTRAVCVRFDLAAIVALLLAGGAMSIYTAAEGVLSWPVVQTEGSAESIRQMVDPGVARALVLSRDGLHAPAAVLLGIAVLLIGWLLLRSGLWGRWVAALLSLLSGGLAMSSIVVGPEGLGPGLIFVVWGVAVPLMLLVGLRRAEKPGTPDAAGAAPVEVPRP